jgi:hypothetical protein
LAIGKDERYLRVERATLRGGVQRTDVATRSRNPDRNPMCHAAPSLLIGPGYLAATWSRLVRLLLERHDSE